MNYPPKELMGAKTPVGNNGKPCEKKKKAVEEIMKKLDEAKKERCRQESERARPK